MPPHRHELDARVLAGEAAGGAEELVPRKDGGTHCVRWSMKPWRAPDGQIGGALLFIELITEQVVKRRASLTASASASGRLRPIRTCWFGTSGTELS
jgi:PAS fold